MAQVVYTDVTGDVGAEGTLFKGMKIWFSQRVPQRQRFVQLVQVSDESSAQQHSLKVFQLYRPMEEKWCRWRRMQMSGWWIMRERKLLLARKQPRRLLAWSRTFIAS